MCWRACVRLSSVCTMYTHQYVIVHVVDSRTPNIRTCGADDTGSRSPKDRRVRIRFLIILQPGGHRTSCVCLSTFIWGGGGVSFILYYVYTIVYSNAPGSYVLVQCDNNSVRGVRVGVLTKYLIKNAYEYTRDAAHARSRTKRRQRSPLMAN